MPQDMDAGRREASCRKVPAEPRVEGRARHAARSGARLPEGCSLGHRCEFQRSVGQRGAQRLVGGVWEFSPTTLAALASICIEDHLALDADVAGGQVDHLRAPSAGEDEGQQ